MTERWMPVPGSEGVYEVSDLGRVRQYLKGHKDFDGYPCISGGKRGRPKRPIHQLVAEAFIGPRPKGMVVRHLNDDPEDNRLVNLAYGSRWQNYVDAVRNRKINPHCERNKAHLARVASLGGAWWRGRKRAGLRGKAVS